MRNKFASNFQMKKEDIVLILLVLFLLLAMIITMIKGGARSRHGYGTAIILKDTVSARAAAFKHINQKFVQIRLSELP